MKMNWNSKLKEQMTVTNHEGAKAYAMTPELELYTAVVTASLSAAVTTAVYSSNSGAMAYALAPS